MKYQIATILIFLTVTVLTMNFECGCNRGPNPFFDPNFPLVKVSATLNDTSAIIHVGDTLIFKLTIPDAFIASNGTEYKVCAFG